MIRRALRPWWPFALVLAAYLLYLPHSGYDQFYFDSGSYWTLSESFGGNGALHLLAYNDPRRGYSFPLALHVARSVGEPLGLGASTIVRISMATTIAVLGTQLLPRLASRLFGGLAVTPARVLVLNALIFTFWADNPNFPLSDFPALTLWVGALLLATRGGLPSLAGAGFLAGLAMNVRPAYTLGGLLLVALVTWRAHGGGPRGRRRAVVAGTVVVGGLAVALAPQVAINVKWFDKPTPFPTNNRTLSQVTQGFRLQKYETLTPTTSRSGQGFFVDPSTSRLLEERHLRWLDNWGTWADIVVAHPLVMAEGYLRRGFNGLDVQYTSPYVSDPHGDRNRLRSLLLYSLLFVAACFIVLPRRRRSLGRGDRTILVLFLLPALVSAFPGAVETRYLLPADVLVYCLAAFGLARTGTRRVPRRGAALVLAVAYVGFVVACFALAASTYSHLRIPTRSVDARLA